jgi:hypothetical protein
MDNQSCWRYLAASVRASLIRYVQRPMNIAALMQEVYDVEQRGLDRHAIRLHRLG